MQGLGFRVWGNDRGLGVSGFGQRVQVLTASARKDP